MNVQEIRITPQDSVNYASNINFNPSIVYLGNDLFLMSFHSFRRGSIKHDNFNSTPSSTNPDHMWYSKLWWNPGPGGFW